MLGRSLKKKVMCEMQAQKSAHVLRALDADLGIIWGGVDTSAATTGMPAPNRRLPGYTLNTSGSHQLVRRTQTVHLD